MRISDWSSDVCSSDLLSLGARCVFAGRPFNYASSVAGAAGVDHAIRILQTELHRNMALLGLNRLEELDDTRVGHVYSLRPAPRPEERCVGKECVSTCTSR